MFGFGLIHSGFSIAISQQEFLLFHNIDRELYKILVLNLSREPTQSMQILAFWLWLERVGFRSVIDKILSLPYTLINAVVGEALTCLNCINTSQTYASFEGNDIPLTRSLVDKEISLQILYENRSFAVQGVTKILDDVCVRALSDIVQQVKVRNLIQSRVEGQIEVMSSSKNHICFGSIEPPNLGVAEVEGAESNTTIK